MSTKWIDEEPIMIVVYVNNPLNSDMDIDQYDSRPIKRKPFGFTSIWIDSEVVRK